MFWEVIPCIKSKNTETFDAIFSSFILVQKKIYYPMRKQ